MSDAQAEAERRYPDNRFLEHTPLYAQLKREGFEAGAEWQASRPRDSRCESRRPEMHDSEPTAL